MFKSDLIACPEISHFYKWGGVFCLRRDALILQVDCIEILQLCRSMQELTAFHVKGDQLTNNQLVSCPHQLSPHCPWLIAPVPFFPPARRQKVAQILPWPIFLPFALLSDARSVQRQRTKATGRERFNLATVFDVIGWLITCHWLEVTAWPQMKWQFTLPQTPTPSSSLQQLSYHLSLRRSVSHTKLRAHGFAYHYYTFWDRNDNRCVVHLFFLKGQRCFNANRKDYYNNNNDNNDYDRWQNGKLIVRLPPPAPNYCCVALF